LLHLSWIVPIIMREVDLWERR